MNKHDLRQYCCSEGRPASDGTPRICNKQFMHSAEDGGVECRHVRTDMFFARRLTEQLREVFGEVVL